MKSTDEMNFFEKEFEDDEDDKLSDDQDEEDDFYDEDQDEEDED